MLTYLYTELVPPNISKFPSSYFLSVTLYIILTYSKLSLKMVTSGQQVFFLEITWCTHLNGCFCPLSIRYPHPHLQKTNTCTGKTSYFKFFTPANFQNFKIYPQKVIKIDKFPLIKISSPKYGNLRAFLQFSVPPRRLKMPGGNEVAE